MNVISFLSNSLPAPQETPIQESDSLLKEKNATIEAVVVSSDQCSMRRKFMRLMWSIMIFLPNYLIVKPCVAIWYVITFPLTLMETNRNDSKRGQIGTKDTRSAEPQSQQDTKNPRYVIEEDLSPNDEIIINQDKMKPRPITETLGKFHFPKKLVPQSMLLSTGRKLLILDLDETLIHSMSSSRSTVASAGAENGKGMPAASAASQMVHLVEVKFPQTNISTLYNVAKRPYCDMFLQHTSQWYDIAIFTASMKEYADPVIDWLQQTCSVQFKHRWYRDHCTLRPGVGYVKDIGSVVAHIETARELSQMIIIDNSPISYAMHLDNAIQVHGWINDPTDSELLHLLPLLKGMRHVTDSRCILALKSGRASVSVSVAMSAR